MTSRFLSAGVLGAVAAIATGVVASAVPLASAAPAAPVDPPGALAATVPPVDTLVWDRCLPDSARDLEVGLPRADVLCAIVPVPVDHADPDGRTIDVSVRRITASVERTGALFGNPGGPGADARDLWYSALDADEDSAVDAIRRHHDLVIVQPRGLEGSGALECLPEVGVDDHAPTVLAKWCMDTDPALVRSFTTENVVRDHELVRERMGLGRISFFGFSYGTALGMVYQTLFPDSIERMVLDSSVGPSDTWWYEFHQRQAENRHQARDYVLAWIAENDATYGLGDTPLAVYGRIRELDRTEGRAASRFLPPPAQPGDRVAGSLPAGPLTSGSVDAIATGSARVDNAALASSGAFDRDVEGAQGYFAVLDMFSRQPGEWSEIAWVISAKIHGTLPDPPSPEELEAMLETRSETPVVTSDMQTYLTILNCNETAPPRRSLLAGTQLGSSESVGSTGEDEWALREQSRYCLYPPSAEAPRIESNRMVAQPLIIQSDHDPNTPGMFGPATADATGGTLVRIRGTVHCHFDTGNEAVDEIVLRYLETGQAEPGQYLDTPRPAPGSPPWVPEG